MVVDQVPGFVAIPLAPSPASAPQVPRQLHLALMLVAASSLGALVLRHHPSPVGSVEPWTAYEATVVAASPATPAEPPAPTRSGDPWGAPPRAFEPPRVSLAAAVPDAPPVAVASDAPSVVASLDPPAAAAPPSATPATPSPPAAPPVPSAGAPRAGAAAEVPLPPSRPTTAPRDRAPGPASTREATREPEEAPAPAPPRTAARPGADRSPPPPATLAYAAEPLPSAVATAAGDSSFLAGFFGAVRGAFAPRAPSAATGGGGRAGVAVYNVRAHTVTLPDGTRLEAHSGLGRFFDDPSSARERNRGATPPHVYDLTLREAAFHGVRALRLTPADGGGVFGRNGLLAHPYLLGGRGESNGCVSFKDYASFLRAFDAGSVRRLEVVEG